MCLQPRARCPHWLPSCSPAHCPPCLWSLSVRKGGRCGEWVLAFAPGSPPQDGLCGFPEALGCTGWGQVPGHFCVTVGPSPWPLPLLWGLFLEAQAGVDLPRSLPYPTALSQHLARGRHSVPEGRCPLMAFCLWIHLTPGVPIIWGTMLTDTRSLPLFCQRGLRVKFVEKVALLKNGLRGSRPPAPCAGPSS